jgi:hypothetical protein
MLGILIAVTSNDNEIYQQERPDKQYYGGGDRIVARLKALSLRGGSRACLKPESTPTVHYVHCVHYVMSCSSFRHDMNMEVWE